MRVLRERKTELTNLTVGYIYSAYSSVSTSSLHCQILMSVVRLNDARLERGESASALRLR